jgi:PhnB protein
MVKAIPDGLSTITPSLSLDGAASAMEFYKKAFGAEEVMRAPDPSGKKIWHADMRIGNSRFFLNDVFSEVGASPSKASLWLYVENVDAAYKRAVDAGCKVTMPLADMFWGDRLGTVVDLWGIQWTLAQHTKDMSPAEMQKAQDDFVKNMKR